MRNLSILMFLLLLLGLSACSSAKKAGSAGLNFAKAPKDAFNFTEQSTDKSYGYTKENPIMVGGGARNEHVYLAELRGPNGEDISYIRLGSCCSFKTPNGFMGAGLLDEYEVSWDGQTEAVHLYINMYDYAPLKVPVGFSRR
ncbi:MAG: 2-dehydro-3-deoxyphosphooctonate aldolase [Bacteroidota bacterium]